MLIRMIKSTPGSEDGITSKMYEAGKEYDMQDALAKVFLAIHVAEDVSLPDVKAVESAPENKMMESPINKDAETKKRRK